jgi:hypothetical protein
VLWGMESLGGAQTRTLGELKCGTTRRLSQYDPAAKNVGLTLLITMHQLIQWEPFNGTVPSPQHHCYRVQSELRVRDTHVVVVILVDLLRL